jgi:hypothetical protein
MTILFTDDFQRADDPAVGTAWIEDTDNYELFGNEVRSDLDFVNNTSGTSLWVTTLAARADATVQALLKSSVVGTNFARFGLVARRTASDTFYGFRVAPNALTGQMLKVVGGTQTNLGIGFSVGDNLVYHSFRFEVFGTSLKVYRDGVLLESLIDGSIIAAGRCGLLLSGDADGDRAFANDFLVADSPGENLLATSTMPVDWRTKLELANELSVFWNMCRDAGGGLLGASLLGGFELGGGMTCSRNFNHILPVFYKVLTQIDAALPVFWKFPEPSKFDHIVPIIWRRLIEIDNVIPIQYANIDPWVKQVISEIEAWLSQGAGEADTWTKQGDAEPSTWTPG